MSSDGAYAHCVRSEHAGLLQPGPDGSYSHLMAGDCRCGAAHGNPSVVIELSRGANGSPRPARKSWRREDASAIYEYTDRHGGQWDKARFDHPDGTKHFAWGKRGAADFGGSSGAHMADMLLYGDTDLAGTVIWCEGEKACDALRAAGFLAVTGAGGSGQREFPPEALEPLRGCETVIWPDNDEPGEKYGANVAQAVAHDALRVRRIDWSDAPPAGDAADAIAAGVDIQALIDAAEEVDTSAPTGRLGQLLESVLDWATFIAKDHQAEDWLHEPIWQRGRSSAIYAPAKQGKTEFVQYNAAEAAKRGVSIFYIDQENTEGDLYEHLEAMGVLDPDTLANLHYALLADLRPLDTKEGGEDLLLLVEHFGAELVIIDTTSRVIQGEENAAETIRNLYQHSIRPLKARGVAVCRLDHSGKDIERGMRGSSAKMDDVDVVWRLARTDDGTKITATHRRQSWVPEEVHFRRLEDPLRYERIENSWPAGTERLAAVLDELEIPTDWGREKVRKRLSGSNHKATTAVLSAAIRYRKHRETCPRTGVEDEGRTGTPDRSGFRFTNSPSDRFGQVLADASDSSASLEADSPDPDRLEAVSRLAREARWPELVIGRGVKVLAGEPAWRRFISGADEDRARAAKAALEAVLND